MADIWFKTTGVTHINSMVFYGHCASFLVLHGKHQTSHRATCHKYEIKKETSAPLSCLTTWELLLKLVERILMWNSKSVTLQPISNESGILILQVCQCVVWMVKVIISSLIIFPSPVRHILIDWPSTTFFALLPVKVSQMIQKQRKQRPAKFPFSSFWRLEK